MQVEQSDRGQDITEESVAGYLIRHPEFFIDNHDTLSRLRVPHDSGSAVSLIEKQVSVLRGRSSHLEKSLRDIIAVARQNEIVHQRLHELIKDIISAPTLADIVALTRQCLHESFKAESVHFMLIANAAESQPVKTSKGVDSSSKAQQRAPRLSRIKGASRVRHTDRRLSCLDELFANGETVCGMPDEQQLKIMVGRQSADIGSAALIPLHYQSRLGVIMLTSRDELRFGANKGVMFLNQLGELLSRRIHSYSVQQSTKARCK